MTPFAQRLLALAAMVAALALPAVALGETHAGINRGVVQSVDASHIVVTALDGSTITFEASPRLVVRIDGRAAVLGEITPGLVADIAVDEKGRAVLVKAFGASVTERGVVTAVSKTALTIVTPTGPKTIAVDRNTRFKMQNGSGGRGAVRVGAAVAITHLSDGPAQVVNVLKRAKA